MFPFPNGEKREIKRQEQSEIRQMNFQREQQIVSSSLDDDAVFYQNKERQDDLQRWQQDLHDEQELLIRTLKNQKFINEKWVQVKDRYGNDLNPMMNEEGIRAVEAIVSPLLSRNIINSNFNEDRVLKILKDTSNTLTNLFARNFDRFEITPDPTNMSNITRIIKNVIIPAPYRALNDGERRHQRTINKRIEAFNETSNPKKNDGFFGKLGFGA